MQVRYHYRLKPEIERKLKEGLLKQWEKFASRRKISVEDYERAKEIWLNTLPGVEPECLIEEAKKLKDPKLREYFLHDIEMYYKYSCIPTPPEWVEGSAPDFAVLPH